MLSSTRKKLSDIPIGATVRVPIDSVDRSKIDPRNFLAQVVDKTANGGYKLGTTSGIYLFFK
jgi:hypothetical protein